MAILIKRYANRKLYNTETSRYITLKGIASLLDDGEEVRVIDNETGEDITQVALSQILVDNQRAKEDPSNTLLTQILSRGGDALYDALKRSVDEASDGIGDFQDRLRQLVKPTGDANDPYDDGDGPRRSPFARQQDEGAHGAEADARDASGGSDSSGRPRRRIGGLPDLREAIQSAVEKAFDNSFDNRFDKMFGQNGRGFEFPELARFPRKRDFDALNENLTRVADAIERLEASLQSANTRPETSASRESATEHD